MRINLKAGEKKQFVTAINTHEITGPAQIKEIEHFDDVQSSQKEELINNIRQKGVITKNAR